MSTTRDLLIDALEAVGAIATGEAPSAADHNKALRAFNQMLGVWGNHSLLINRVTTETFNLVPGQSSYTIGVGANFDTARPTQILKANLKTLDLETPLEIINYQYWARISTKNLESSLPCKLYYEPAVPGLIHLYPIPNTAYQLVLMSLKPFSEIANANVDDALTYPPGYEEAIVYNLAIRLAGPFGKQLSQEVKDIAYNSLNSIKKLNSRPITVKSDVYGLVGNRSTFNVKKGE